MAGQPIQYSDIISPEVQKQLDELKKTIASLVEELTKLNSQTDKTDSTNEDYTKTLRDEVEVTDDLLKLVQDEIVLKKEVAKVQKKYDKAVESGSTKQDEYAIAAKKGKESILAHNVVLKNATKLAIANKTSMVELSLELAKNKLAYRKLTKEQRENEKVGGKLVRKIKTQDKEIKKLDKSIGDSFRNVGNYNSIVSGLSSTFSGFSSRLYIVGSAFRTYTSILKTSTIAMAGMSKGAKALRVALISTGIGAIVVIIGTLITYLAGATEGTGKLAKVAATLRGVFDGIVDTAKQIGEAFYYLFTGEFSKAWETGTTAVLGFGDAISSAMKHQREMLDLTNELNDVMRFSNSFLNSLRISSKKLEETYNNTNLTLQTRIDAWKEWQKVQIQIADKNISIALSELKIAEGTAKAKEATEEQKKAWDDAIVVWQNAQGVRNEIVNGNWYDALKKEVNITKELVGDLQTWWQQIMKISDAEQKLYDDRARRQQKYIKAIGEEFEFEDEHYIDDIPDYITNLAAQGDAQELTGAQIASSIQGLSGIISQSSKENKEIQMATALINTFAGVGYALASGVPPYNFIQAALVLAAGIANVNQMANTDVGTFAVGTESVDGDQLAQIHDKERILPAYINKQITGISNAELPSIINMGLKVPALAAGIDRMISKQDATNSLLRRFAYVDGSGRIHYLTGDTRNYV